MQQLFYFLRKSKFFLFFIFLEIIAVVLIINNHSFHKSKYITSANAITGGIQERSSNISEYLNLKSQNKTLAEENTKLKNLLEKYQKDNLINTTIVDSVFNLKLQYINGKVVSNNYNSPFNFITINRGKSHGIDKEMAVVSSHGIVGVTETVKKNYSRIQSILNKDIKINARFKNSFHFGTLTWNGEDYTTVQLTDIPRQAVYTIGDTIITGGKSTIFPEGILIGTVAVLPDRITASNTIGVKLFNDMTNLGYINVITHINKEEIKDVEQANE